MLKPLFSAILACLAAAASATSPPLDPCAPAMLHGSVRELGSPDGLPGALLVAWVEGVSFTAQSDALGAYRLSLDPGLAHLSLSAADHSPLKPRTLSLKPGQDLRLNLSLARNDFTAEEFVVRGKKDRPQALTTTFSQHEIKKIPGTGGDALRAVQNMPGVAAVSDYSSQMVVQGGGPNDNLYLLDNIPWPFPFHFGGIISTVNSDLLSDVDLNGAGFDARWGNVMGAVLDARTRAPKKDRLHLSVDISLIMTQVMVEGPLGIGDASFSLAGRRSYLDLVLSHMGGGSSDFTALPVFWDLGGTLDFSLGAHNHIRALALGDDDLLGLVVKPTAGLDPKLVGEFHLDNSAVTSGLSWSNTSLEGLNSTLTPYTYATTLEDSLGTGIDINLKRRVYGVKEEAIWRPGSLLGMAHEIGFGGGAEIEDDSTLFYAFENFFNSSSSNSGPLSTTVTSQSVNRSAYLQDRVQLSRDWAATAGLHYDKNDQVADDLLMPRLGLEWKMLPSTTWKAAWGYYDQFPGGNQTNPQIGNPDLSANLAQHSVLSVEQRLGGGLWARLDAYYKSYSDLVVSQPTAQFYNNAGSGSAKGLEFFLKENMGERFFGWISYAYSRSERQDGPSSPVSLYQYDQTHILTLVASYNPTLAWSVGAKLRYNSGPLVQTYLGRTQDSQGDWHGVFSDQYNQRLADYLRLDLRTDYSWLLQGWQIGLYVEVLNVLDRPNPEGLDYPRDYASPPSVVDNLGRFPYAGVEFKY